MILLPVTGGLLKIPAIFQRECRLPVKALEDNADDVFDEPRNLGSWDSEPKRRHLFVFHIVRTDGVPTPLELAREVTVTPMNGEVGVIVPQEHRTVFRDPNLTASRNDVPIRPLTSVAFGTGQSMQQLLRAVIVCFINHRISFHKDRTHCSRTQYVFARSPVRIRSNRRRIPIPSRTSACLKCD